MEIITIDGVDYKVIERSCGVPKLEKIAEPKYDWGQCFKVESYWGKPTPVMLTANGEGSKLSLTDLSTGGHYNDPIDIGVIYGIPLSEIKKKVIGRITAISREEAARLME